MVDIKSVDLKTIAGDGSICHTFQKMEQNCITQLVVVDDAGIYKGMVHIHDILREGVV